MEREPRTAPAPAGKISVKSIPAKAIKLRGLGAEPQQPLAKKTPASHLRRYFVQDCSHVCVSSTSHLSALLSGMSLFAPGFAITSTALNARTTPRLPVLGRRHGCQRWLPIALFLS